MNTCAVNYCSRRLLPSRPPPRTDAPTSTHIPRDVVSHRCIITGTVHPADTGQSGTAHGGTAKPHVPHHNPCCFPLPHAARTPNYTELHSAWQRWSPPKKARPAVALESWGEGVRWGRVYGAMSSTTPPGCTSAVGPRSRFLLGQTPVGTGGWCCPIVGTGLQVTG